MRSMSLVVSRFFLSPLFSARRFGRHVAEAEAEEAVERRAAAVAAAARRRILLSITCRGN